MNNEEAEEIYKEILKKHSLQDTYELRQGFRLGWNGALNWYWDKANKRFTELITETQKGLPQA